MNRTRLIAMTAALVAAIGSHASAAVIDGPLFKVDQPSNIDIAFVSSSNGLTGSLYFSGYEFGGIMHRADNSDRNALGTFLFDTLGNTPDFSVDLGKFDTGSILHFSYLVYAGDRAGGNVRYTIQTESPEDFSRFSFAEINPVSGSYRTTSLNFAAVDGSRSDLHVNIVASVIPSPAATGMLALTAGFCVARRRRLR